MAKKQKTCAANTAKYLDTVIGEVEAAQARMLAARGNGMKAAQELHARLQNMDLIALVTSQTKEVHSAVTKLGRVRITCCSACQLLCTCYAEGRVADCAAACQSVEKAFVPDMCAATREVKFNEATLNGGAPLLCCSPATCLSAVVQQAIELHHVTVHVCAISASPWPYTHFTLTKWLHSTQAHMLYAQNHEMDRATFRNR